MSPAREICHPVSSLPALPSLRGFYEDKEGTRFESVVISGGYGYRDQAEVGTDLYLLAVSPLTMTDEKGDPCGLDVNALTKGWAWNDWRSSTVPPP